MGLLRLATVGAIGYFAYRALQNRNGGNPLDDTRADSAPVQASGDAALDDDDTTDATADVTPSAGARRPS